MVTLSTRPVRGSAVTSAGPGPGRSARARRDLLDGLLFIAPFMVIYALFLVLPVVQATYMSGFNWDLLGSMRTFIGADNYTRMLWGEDIVWSVGAQPWLRMVVLLGTAWLLYTGSKRDMSRLAMVLIGVTGVALAVVLGFHPSATGAWNDPGFWISLRHTLVFTLVSTPILVGLPLALALALTTKRRGSRSYRAIFFLPWVLPISAVTLIWSYLLNPDRGLIAGFLGWFGVEPIGFLSDPDLAMPAIIATTVWWSLGFNLVLFMAGLQDIDPNLYEAASLDGANGWQRFRHVTLPGLRHVSVLVAVTQLIASFQIFGQVYIMTRGGPGTSTEVLIQHIYEAGFKNYQLGYAATLSVFLFVVMSAVSAIQFRLIARGT
jgi:multiple sugar transport system permease protein